MPESQTTDICLVPYNDETHSKSISSFSNSNLHTKTKFSSEQRFTGCWILYRLPGKEWPKHDITCNILNDYSPITLVCFTLTQNYYSLNSKYLLAHRESITLKESKLTFFYLHALLTPKYNSYCSLSNRSIVWYHNSLLSLFNLKLFCLECSFLNNLLPQALPNHLCLQNAKFPHYLALFYIRTLLKV